VVDFNFPSDPVVGQEHTEAGITYVWNGYGWAIQSVDAAPAVADSVAIACSFVGKPAVSAAVFIPITMSLSIPANLEGSVGYARTAATANAVFSVSKISFGVAVELGTITAVAGLQTGFILSGAGGLLVAGDVLQFFGPATQDATLADVGITLHAAVFVAARLK
jgi:hypothetical protein